MRVLFFASLRDEVGVAELELSASPASIDALFAALGAHLSADAIEALRGDNVKVAVDQSLVAADTDISGAREIAFLPPVTGG